MSNQYSVDKIKGEKLNSSNSFSFFPSGIRYTKPTKELNLAKVFESVCGLYYKSKIVSLRDPINRSYKEKIKTSLAYITPAGIFSERRADALLSRSGVFCVDIDHLSNDKLVELKYDLIINTLCPALLFVSPSGDGLKVFYKIDIEAGEHSEYFKAFQQYFREFDIEIDKQCGDISRACFLSWDPEAFYKEDSQTFGSDFLNKYPPFPTPQQANNKTIEPQRDYNKELDVLTAYLEKNEIFQEGNRNNFVLRLTGACNRVGIPKKDTENLLIQYERSGFSANEIRSIINSAYRHKEWHNIAPLKLSPEDVFADTFFDAENAIIGNKVSFPIDGLPLKLQEFISDCSKVYKTPHDFFAFSFIMAISASLGDKVFIENEYKNYPQLWGMIVAPSGVGKSKPARIAFEPIKQCDSDKFRHYQTEIDFWKADCTGAKRDKRPEPIKPILKQRLITDATPEALFEALSHNNCLTLYRDEIAGWFNDMGRYNKSGEIQHYISLFDNDDVRINRKQSEPILINNPVFCVFGGIQPAVLEKTFNSDSLTDNGMAQRFLFVYPDDVAKPKYHKGIIRSDLKEWYNIFITDILCFSPISNVFRLSYEAESLFIEFSDRMTDMINSTEIDYLRSLYSKMSIHCLRLSLLVFIADLNTRNDSNPNNEINKNSMEYAIRLCEYFIYSGEKVYRLLIQKKTIKQTFIGKEESIKALMKNYPNLNQSKLADSLGITRQQVNKCK